MPKKLSDAEVIQAEFARRFSTWDIPVEDLATHLQKLPNDQRQGHYLKIKEIVEHPSFQLEINDWLRRLSRVLAMGMHNNQVLTEDQENGLRQTMLEVEAFPKVLAKRALNLSPTAPLRARRSSL